MSKFISSNKNQKPSLDDIKARLASKATPSDRTTLLDTPITPNTKGQHILYIGDSAADTLISQVEEAIRTRNRIVVTVTSNAMIDEVRELLESAGLTSDKEIDISIYKTKSYLYRKHFNISYQYREDTPPWEYSGTESEHDLNQRKKVEASKLWKLKLEHAVSDSVFRHEDTDEIKIVIMVNGVLFNVIRTMEMERQDAHVIMFKPGINDFQNYYIGDVTYPDNKRHVEFKERPDGSRFPELLEYLNVTYILESGLVKDLIKSPNNQQYRDGNLAMESVHGHERHHNISILTSHLTSKRYSGTFPIIFNILNKASFKGNAVLMGDGMGSQHSFNRIRAGIIMIDAPVVVKLSEPPPKMIEVLAMQLKDPDQQVKQAFQDIKKRIVIDYVESVLRRIQSGRDIYFVCDPKLPKWLKEEIQAFADVKSIRISDEAIYISDDKGKPRRLRVDEDGYPIAHTLHQSLVETVKLTKSKPALRQWIKSNDVVGENLEKVIVNLMVTVTMAIREGFDGIQPMPRFKFTEEFGDRMEVEDRGYVRLVESVDSSISRYFRDDEAYSSVYERYRKSPYV